jgi:hypothetical protein
MQETISSFAAIIAPALRVTCFFDDFFELPILRVLHPLSQVIPVQQHLKFELRKTRWVKEYF